MSAEKHKPRVVVLGGPTGVGKTGAAIELARRFSGRIVSADSMQIYRCMDIGTAKPSPAERQQIPHYLIDIAAPDEAFSAGRYARLAREIIDGLLNEGWLPFITGGSGLYIKACLHGLMRGRSADSAVLERLNREAEQAGPQALHERLRKLDPAAAMRINTGDTFRIVRALELLETTGRPASEHARKHNFAEMPYNALKICLYREREELYQRINRRVDQMLTAGLVEEVKGLLEKGYGPELKSMQSLGYRHVLAYLDNSLDWEEMRRTMQRDTRRFAKRQLTWFNGDPEFYWVDAKEGLEKLQYLIKNFLEAESGIR